MKLIGLLLVLTVSSCSLFNKRVEFKENQELLKSIAINKNSNDSVIFIARQVLKDNIQKAKFNIIKKQLKAHNYNNLLLKEARRHKESAMMNSRYSAILTSKLFLKIEDLKLKKINKDYHKYLKEFFKDKRNIKRQRLIKALVDIDFPSMLYVNLVSKATALATKYDNLYDQINYYMTVETFLTSSLYNINLYLYKSVPTSLLESVYLQTQKKEYISTRLYAEKLQTRVHEKILNKIVADFKRNKLIYADIFKVEKGASFSPAPLKKLSN